jgi:hypothetical protein
MLSTLHPFNYGKYYSGKTSQLMQSPLDCLEMATRDKACPASV